MVHDDARARSGDTGWSPDTATTDAGRAGLAALLTDPRHAVVAVDYDGTLAPIVADPTAARPAPGAVDVLARLARLVGALVVLTGRPAAQAVTLAGLDARTGHLGGLGVLGHYGLEHWDSESGELHSPPPAPGVAQARTALPALLADAGVAADIEDKGSSLAVHVRRLADPAAALETLRPLVQALAAHCGLVVEPGRAVLELRPAGIDKGVALGRLVASVDAPCAVVMIGDDLGDVAAFDAVGKLRDEGIPGVLVCSASGEVDALLRRADVVVEGPAGVVWWLGGLADALERADT